MAKTLLINSLTIQTLDGIMLIVRAYALKNKNKNKKVKIIKQSKSITLILFLISVVIISADSHANTFDLNE
jgi:hypothetical protein